MTLPAMMTSCGAIRSAMTPPTSSEDQRRRDLRGQHVGQVGGRAVVASSTANETPTSEKANAAGASTRSASSSRKSRIARTGSRPRAGRQAAPERTREHDKYSDLEGRAGYSIVPGGPG